MRDIIYDINGPANELSLRWHKWLWPICLCRLVASSRNTFIRVSRYKQDKHRRRCKDDQVLRDTVSQDSHQLDFLIPTNNNDNYTWETQRNTVIALFTFPFRFIYLFFFYHDYYYLFYCFWKLYAYKYFILHLQPTLDKTKVGRPHVVHQTISEALRIDVVNPTMKRRDYSRKFLGYLIINKAILYSLVKDSVLITSMPRNPVSSMLMQMLYQHIYISYGDINLCSHCRQSVMWRVGIKMINQPHKTVIPSFDRLFVHKRNDILFENVFHC